MLHKIKRGLKSTSNKLYKAAEFVILVLFIPETWAALAVATITTSIVFSIFAILQDNSNYILVAPISMIFTIYALIFTLEATREKYGRLLVNKGSPGRRVTNIVKVVIICQLAQLSAVVLNSIFMYDGSKQRMEVLYVNGMCSVMFIVSCLVIAFHCHIDNQFRR